MLGRNSFSGLFPGLIGGFPIKHKKCINSSFSAPILPVNRARKGTREECFIPLSERNEPTPNILNKEKRNYIKIEFKDRESYGFQASSRN